MTLIRSKRMEELCECAGSYFGRLCLIEYGGNLQNSFDNLQLIKFVRFRRLVNRRRAIGDNLFGHLKSLLHIFHPVAMSLNFIFVKSFFALGGHLYTLLHG